jgi:hypothetical protein
VRGSGVLLAALAFLSGCTATAEHRSYVSAQQDISEIQTQRTLLGNGASGAPVDGVVVSGEITNVGSSPLRCNASAFLLTDAAGNASVPRSQWCDVPAVGPHRSASFTATFATTGQTHLQLRFEHPDGTYEAHTLIVPPA